MRTAFPKVGWASGGQDNFLSLEWKTILEGGRTTSGQWYEDVERKREYYHIIGSRSWDFLGFSSTVRQMPGDLCTAPRIIALSHLSLATDVSDATFGASGLWLGTRTGAGGTATLIQSFFSPQPMVSWTTGHIENFILNKNLDLDSILILYAHLRCHLLPISSSVSHMLL